MNKRLQEILARKMEIRSALQSGDKVDLSAIEQELKDLETEELEIRKKHDIASKINLGGLQITDIEKPEEKRKKGDQFDTPEYRQAFFDYVKTGVMAAEYRAATTTADAGAMIPTTTINKIIEKLTSKGMILPLVTQTSYKTGVAIPTSDVKPKATWVAESKSSDKQNQVVGSITFAAYKLRCAVGVSLEMNSMSLSAFENAIIKNISDAMIIAIEEAIISGTGKGTPKGIIVETAPEGQAIEVSTIDYKTMVTVEGAIPSAYETGAVYVMTKKTFMEFVGMVDSQKQPIARVNYGINGAADRSLLGRKVVICDYLPNFSAAAAGEVFAFVFRMEDYVLNTAYNVTLKQYEDNETDDIVRKAIMLADGKVVDKNSLVTLAKPKAAA